VLILVTYIDGGGSKDFRSSGAAPEDGVLSGIVLAFNTTFTIWHEKEGGWKAVMIFQLWEISTWVIERYCKSCKRIDDSQK